MNMNMNAAESQPLCLHVRMAIVFINILPPNSIYPLRFFDSHPLMNLPTLLQLISSAFQRCRASEHLCRLSITLRLSNPSNVQISISDTGIGSCLDEFLDLKLCLEDFGSEYWDGVLSVTTTSISDDEIHNYRLSTKECVSERRLTRLPSKPKNGGKFSGTEVCLLVSKNPDVLVGEIKCFLQKMLILKIPSVAIELVVEREDTPGSKDEYIFLANECNPLPFSASNLERLKSGLEEYVLKHGNILNTQCRSCFPSSGTLKVGSGISSQTKSRRSTGLVMEAVIIISEIIDQTSTCFRPCSARTEVLYFKDYSSCTISQSSLKALRSIDWRSYGLILGSVENRGSSVLLEWENLPAYAHIDIVLHLYNEQYPTSCHTIIVMVPSTRPKIQLDSNLTKKALKLALDDLRDKHAGVLLSAHALKIRSYAPDLAKTIAGLILSSEDTDFQTECFSLLGLESQGVGGETVEACINEKIISVIETNDKKPQRSKDVAPFLFEDDGGFLESGLEYDEYEDDIILTGSDPTQLDRFVTTLHREFSIRDLGPLHYFLGIEVTCTSGQLHLSQQKYINDILSTTNMLDSKPAPTPGKVGKPLSQHDGMLLEDPTEYRRIVGSLQYVTMKRPNIAFAVNCACQFMHSPTSSHLLAVKRILRYLRGTSSHGITLQAADTFHLSAFTDADWASSLDDRRSMGGYCVFLGESLVSWSSAKQKVVSRSSTESEFQALANVAAELSWYHRLFADRRLILSSSPIM
ncbi:type 2 DNA topoisomerase 6 subunit B-like [Humulus lupulus]|uniref:type 2 DNA topoisomerase 6 subunit B-like n=1 Tax=Humulus lupulus TaxID=3486 RepID=UPI002B4136D6|nr:type 2 DNA topoisomerase 6 subunit B-like [Humulus lupulus]